MIELILESLTISCVIAVSLGREVGNFVHEDVPVRGVQAVSLHTVNARFYLRVRQDAPSLLGVEFNIDELPKISVRARPFLRRAKASIPCTVYEASAMIERS